MHMQLDHRMDGRRFVSTLAAAVAAASLATTLAAQVAPKKPDAPGGAPVLEPVTPAQTQKPIIGPRGTDAVPAKAPTVREGGPSLATTPGAAPTRPGAAINEPPVIEFDPPIADMGEMIADVAETLVVKIRNVSDKPVRISKAIPGCGCTVPTWPKDPIPPGGVAETEITLKPGSKQGIKLVKKVTYQIEDHAPVTLTVQGDVVAYVTMVPDTLDAPADLASAEGTEITFESTDGTAFRITEFVPPIVKGLPTEAATKHVVKIDWGMWEEVGRQPKVVAKTDNPKAEQLTMLIKRNLGANIPQAPNAPRTPAPGTTDLITAVRAGDMGKVSALIASGTDVNERDRAGSRTALYWAAKTGNRAALEALVAAKADPNLTDRQGRTALWGAVDGSIETVKYLVDNGATVNVRDNIKSSPLLWAAGFGKPETVAYLLSKGADVKIVDDNGWTALIWAAGLGDPMTVDLLVKAGADVAVADKQTGDTALLRGARTGKVDGVKVLLAAGADIKAKNKLGQTALHLAAASGSADKVAALLAAGADPAATDEKGWTALDHAMNRTTGDKTKLLEILKPVSPAPKSGE